MRVVIFCHSMRSDWNHGNAHFLRGVASELGRRGHEVTAFEPEDGWSATNLAREAGAAALACGIPLVSAPWLDAKVLAVPPGGRLSGRA